MLELREVSYRRDRRTILDRVDLRFEPGTITALIGPAGSGKSSLLRLLSGELRPTSGSITQSGRRFGAGDAAESSPLVLLDEPGRSTHVCDLPALLHRLAMRGATVVAALHDLTHARLLADRAIVMHRGQVVADGLPQIVLEPALLAMVFGLPCAIGRVHARVRRTT